MKLVLALTGTIILMLVALWIIPKIQLNAWMRKTTLENAPKLENEFRRTVAQIIGGMVVMLGIYFTWQELKSTTQSLELTRSGQIAERFTNAVDQLSDKDRMERRLGGIHALTGIARTSKNDRNAVLNILAAFIRENARWSVKDVSAMPGRDVQTAMDAISNILEKIAADTQEPRHAIDLTGANLRGVDLTGATLNGVKFNGAHLEHANLSKGNFTDARFEEARLDNSTAKGIIAPNAVFFGASLTEANFEGAKLGNANFNGAILEEVNFRNAMLRGCDLREAPMRGTHLEGTDLRDARVSRGQVESAHVDSRTRLPEGL